MKKALFYSLFIVGFGCYGQGNPGIEKKTFIWPSETEMDSITTESFSRISKSEKEADRRYVKRKQYLLDEKEEIKLLLKKEFGYFKNEPNLPEVIVEPKNKNKQE